MPARTLRGCGTLPDPRRDGYLRFQPLPSL